MEHIIDKSNALMHGHILIRDAETKEVIVNKRNAIHFENMSVSLARSLANKDNGPLFEMSFGNGASNINGLGIITYLPPNVVGQTADLYNETFSSIIDENRGAPIDNGMEIIHQSGALFTDIVITVTLGFGEPAGQEVSDDASDSNGEFIFDELGLKSFDLDPTKRLLLTHVIFNPVQKSLNRTIEVQYTLRIQMC